MGDIAEVVVEAVEKGQASRLNGIIAVLVAVSATFMAVCNVKDGNVVQAMSQAQAHEVDAWGYYQSKSTKQHLAEALQVQLAVQRDAAASLTPEGRALIDAKVAEYVAKAKQYEADKADIKRSAEGFQKEYRDLNIHDDQFDMAEASLSVAISLFSVTALTRKRWLLGLASAAALFGVVLGVSGFLGLKLHPAWLATLLG